MALATLACSGRDGMLACPARRNWLRAYPQSKRHWAFVDKRKSRSIKILLGAKPAGTTGSQARRREAGRCRRVPAFRNKLGTRLCAPGRITVQHLARADPGALLPLATQGLTAPGHRRWSVQQPLHTGSGLHRQSHSLLGPVLPAIDGRGREQAG